VKKITLDFLRWIIGERDAAAIRSAVDEIIRCGDNRVSVVPETGSGCCRDCCDRGYRAVPHEVATGREGDRCRDCSEYRGRGAGVG